MFTPNVIGFVIGLAFILPMIWWSRRYRAEHWLWAASLITLPIIYAMFGVLADDYGAVRLELIYGVPFFAAGILFLVLDMRLSAYFVGAIWVLHAGYDFYHDIFFTNPGVWSWYPMACAVIDFIVGAYLLILASKLPEGRLKLAPH